MPSVTLVESRAVTRRTHSAITRSRGWELYWPDRDSNFHVYELLLAEIQRDPTCIFFG
jgi:hypothetical protein